MNYIKSNAFVCSSISHIALSTNIIKALDSTWKNILILAPRSFKEERKITLYLNHNSTTFNEIKFIPVFSTTLRNILALYDDSWYKYLENVVTYNLVVFTDKILFVNVAMQLIQANKIIICQEGTGIYNESRLSRKEIIKNNLLNLFIKLKKPSLEYSYIHQDQGRSKMITHTLAVDLIKDHLVFKGRNNTFVSSLWQASENAHDLAMLGKPSMKIVWIGFPMHRFVSIPDYIALTNRVLNVLLLSGHEDMCYIPHPAEPSEIIDLVKTRGVEVISISIPAEEWLFENRNALVLSVASSVVLNIAPFLLYKPMYLFDIFDYTPNGSSVLAFSLRDSNKWLCPESIDSFKEYLVNPIINEVSHEYKVANTRSINNLMTS
jgi:hypothetical protein